MMIEQIVATLAARFSEPSSWAGLAPILVMLGLNVPPGVSQAIALIGAGMCCLVAFFLPEGRRKGAA